MDTTKSKRKKKKVELDRLQLSAKDDSYRFKTSKYKEQTARMITVSFGIAFFVFIIFTTYYCYQLSLTQKKGENFSVFIDWLHYIWPAITSFIGLILGYYFTSISHNSGNED